MTASDQFTLSLPHREVLGREDFLCSEANAEALAIVEAWEQWPGRRLALIGPPRSGKTHLAHVWMAATGAVVAEARTLGLADPAPLAAARFVVVENADRLGDARTAEDALFHLYNLMAAEGGHLLLTARSAPTAWPLATPDLASRVQSLALARIQPPDDTLLSSVLIKLFRDRQIDVSPDVVRFLAKRMDRSFAAAESIVAKLDGLSLTRKRPVTRAMAAEVLGDGAAAE
ncbi:MAG: DnaA/Hda family protein [Pseudomonadota bacterium]